MLPCTNKRVEFFSPGLAVISRLEYFVYFVSSGRELLFLINLIKSVYFDGSSSNIPYRTNKPKQQILRDT